VNLADSTIRLDRYPKLLTLEDGISVIIRPLEPRDEPRLLSFFQSVREEERYWLREDVSDPSVIHRWLTDLNYERVLPLVAERDGVIIADGTLHRRGYGARHRLGEVRLVVAPAYRSRGLGYAILTELMEIGQESGLDRLEAEIVAGAQAAAFEAIEQMGFEQVARLPGHLIGLDGERHDLALFVIDLQDDGG
jgi:RimJ/RimL family protein N-acetyltransferase